jgi:hypothetical protein
MSLLFPYYMDLYHLRQGLHVIAASWDHHGGAKRVAFMFAEIRFVSPSPPVVSRLPRIGRLGISLQLHSISHLTRQLG